MHSKISYIIFHLLSLYCNIGENADTPIKEQDTSPRPAERACQEIIKNFKSPVGNYIVNGVKAEPGEFPYMVTLAIDLGSKGVDVCGGALISPTYVLTAAHCVPKVQADKVRARVGSLKIAGGSKFDPNTDMTVTKIFIHPRFDFKKAINDIALLRLPRPVNTTANVSPICLETNNADPKEQLIIAGWGRTKHYDPASPVLLKAYLKAVSQAKCSEFYRGITKEQICAMDPTHKQDTCQGDSGSPLVVPAKDGRSRLEGVDSYGRVGCTGRYPKVFTRVSRYLGWIEGIVWPNNS